MAILQVELRDVDSGNKVNERLRTDEAIESIPFDYFIIVLRNYYLRYLILVILLFYIAANFVDSVIFLIFCPLKYDDILNTLSTLLTLTSILLLYECVVESF